MNFFSRIAARWRAETPVDSSRIRRGDGVWEAFTGADGEIAPSERKAMTVTAIWACAQLIAGAIAALPMQIKRRSPDGDLRVDPNADLWWILNEQFAPRWPASAGWQFLTASKLLHGDGFAEIVRSRSGAIRSLIPIHPDRVRVIATPDGARLVYEIQPDPTISAPDAMAAQVRVLDQDDVLHVPGFGFNGLRGMSALRFSLRNSGTLSLNAQTFSAKFLENMARPDFVLKAQNNLTDDQFERLQGMLEDHRGPTRAGRPMVLEGGLDIHSITMPIKDLQLIETRKFQIEEIARAFGVQPFMIGHMEKTTSWGTGVEAMGAGFVRYTLRDHLNAFENEMNRKFFRSASRVAQFDTAELERGDTKAMFEAARIAIGRAGEPALMTIEEAREQFLRLPREMEGTVPQHASVAPTETTDPEETGE
ncbi:phage portal protein [Rhodobacterales bacterium HKCCE4037]|nr:phage portal protein [Rhodobacterales bacterium HKCCE4037]